MKLLPKFLTFQVIYVALHKLMIKAHRAAADEGAMETWCLILSQTNDNFQYWLMVLSFINLVLTFVRAQRIGSFPLYVASIQEMMPFIFAFDHTNYILSLVVSSLGRTFAVRARNTDSF